MTTLIIPDLGGASQVEIIEIAVKPGDTVTPEQTVLVLETDKATMEIPAEKAGVIKALKVKTGDKVSSGDAFAELEESAAASSSSDPLTEKTAEKTAEKAAEKTPEENTAAAVAQSELTLAVPDLGGAGKAAVIEIALASGSPVQAGDTLLVLESDKASMEIPADQSGRIVQWLVKVGDQVQAGDPMLVLAADAEAQLSASAAVDNAVADKTVASTAADKPVTANMPATAVADIRSSVQNSGDVHAGPAVRKLARELGVDLALVNGSGRRARITKEDVQAYVKARLSSAPAAADRVIAGSGIPPVPVVDFSQFGAVEQVPLNNIKRATARAMTTAWLNVPQVTQFDLADITDLEAYRVAQNQRFSKQGLKFSIVPFVLKALAWALKEYPSFNASLSPDGQSLIMKKYVHIGVAVDTPKGLLVPVIRDVDQKSVTQITQDLVTKAGLARDGKLSLADMQGGCFSLSSLGGIGGTAFTPIVSPPEVAILGLSKASMQPVWNGETFVPRLMLPLSLSYDHRVVDGAEAARFSQALVACLEDMRNTLM